MNEIIEFICQELNINKDKINSVSQCAEVSQARSIIAYFSHYHAGYTLKTISIYFERRADNISETMHRHLIKNKIQARLNQLSYAFQRRIIELRD